MASKRTKTFSITTIPGFTFMAIATFVILYAPIATLVIYSFNGGTSVAAWGGFSTKWYAVAWENSQVQEATLRSVFIATLSSAIATTLATMAALGTTRRGPTAPGRTAAHPTTHRHSTDALSCRAVG